MSAIHSFGGCECRVLIIFVSRRAAATESIVGAVFPTETKSLTKISKYLLKFGSLNGGGKGVRRHIAEGKVSIRRCGHAEQLGRIGGEGPIARYAHDSERPDLLVVIGEFQVAHGWHAQEFEPSHFKFPNARLSSALLLENKKAVHELSHSFFRGGGGA